MGRKEEAGLWHDVGSAVVGCGGGNGPQAAQNDPASTPDTGAEAAVTPPLLKLTAPEPSERDIHIACRDLLNLCLAPPAMWAPYPAGVTVLTPQQFAQYSRFGLKRGFPDLMIFFGQVYGIELKRRKGRLSKTREGRTRKGSPRILEGQEDVFPKLIATGAWGAIEVAHSVDEVCALLDLWHIPRLGGRSWLAVLQRPKSAPLGATSEKRVAGGSIA